VEVVFTTPKSISLAEMVGVFRKLRLGFGQEIKQDAALEVMKGI